MVFLRSMPRLSKAISLRIAGQFFQENDNMAANASMAVAHEFLRPKKPKGELTKYEEGLKKRFRCDPGAYMTMYYDDPRRA